MDAYQWKVGVEMDAASEMPNVVMSLVDHTPSVTIIFTPEQADSMAETLREKALNARRLARTAQRVLRNMKES